MGQRPLLVDGRAVDHPTAGGHGIGNYTAGLLHGLQEIEVPTTALVTAAADSAVRAGGSVDVREWSPAAVRQFAGSHYVATGMFLPPVPFDPIPRVVTEAGLLVIALMYDVIPFRRPDVYLVDDDSMRHARLRADLFSTVDATVAISQFSADSAVDELALDPHRVRVIGAGVGAAFAPGPPAGKAAQTIVTAITGADPRKNTEGLLAAWSRLPASLRSACHLHVVVADAPPTLVASWRTAAAELGCSDSVVFVGWLTELELVDLLRRSALAVQPSLDEGFGLPVLEAAACGVPSICSDVASMPEILDEPAATFDPRDLDDMAAAIERGLTDGAHRDRLVAAGERAVAAWRWDVVARRLMGVIDEVVPGPVARQPVAERVALLGTAEVTALAEALTNAGGIDTVALVDTGGTPERVNGGAGRSWPAASFGRLVKVHDFDHVIACLDGRAHEVSARIAARMATHVWVRSATGFDGAALARARSVIVDDPALADPLSHLPDPPPVLVLDPSAPGARTAEALALWLRSDPHARGAVVHAASMAPA